MDILQKIYEILRRVCNLESGKQPSIQFQDETINLGDTNVNTVNFTGSPITATRTGNTINVEVTVPPQTPFELVHEDTVTIDLEGEGTIEDPLTAEVILSNDEYQAIEERLDGLFANVYYVEKTKAEIDTLILADGLLPGALYKITGVDTALYGGTDIFVKALTVNTLEEKGTGIFYNPKYEDFPIWDPYSTITISLQSGVFTINETVTANNGATATLFDDAAGLLIPLTGDWSTATSITGGTSGKTATVSGFVAKTPYAIGEKVIWGGKVWENLSGSTLVGSSTNQYTLTGGWVLTAVNSTNYNTAYDEIKYDYTNDFIYYRKDTLGNEVSTNYYTDINIRPDDKSVIEAFQWGKQSTHSNIIINSYCRNINNRFLEYSYNIINERSNVLDNYGNNFSGFSYNEINLSTVSDNSVNDTGGSPSTFSSNIINSSTVSSCRFFENSYFTNNIVKSSFISTNSIQLVTFSYNTIIGNSTVSGNYRNTRIEECILSNGGYITDNAFTGTATGAFTKSGFYRNSCSNLSGFYGNVNLSGSPSYINYNTLSDFSEIGSNTIPNASTIIYNNLKSNSSIQSNNCNYFLCEYNDLSRSTINSNTGDIEIDRNKLSSFSSINNNTPINAGYLEIDHNTLISEAGITHNRPNASNSSIRYNNIKTGSITYVDFTNNSYIRNVNIEDERFNRRATTRITVSEPVYDCSITSNEMLLTIQKTVTGAANAGAVGALSIQTYVIPTNFFIDEVWADLRTGITYGATAALNVGLETDGTTSGLDNTTGDLATINNAITKVVKSTYVPAAANRLLVASVSNAALTAGTLYLKVKLKKLKRISFP